MPSLFILPVALAFVACENMNTPIRSSDFDPLGPPGSMRGSNSSFGSDLSPGQFVSAAIDNTAFYKNKPKSNEDADKLIVRGTQMKIVAVEGNYVKVELDSGEVGYVPSVMISSRVEAADDMIQVVEVDPLLPMIDPDAAVDATTPNLDSVPKIEADAGVEGE